PPPKGRLALPPPVYEVTPQGTAITTEDRNVFLQAMRRDEEELARRRLAGGIIDITPTPAPGTRIVGDYILRSDGTPFRSEAVARQAARNRRLDDYEPVQVEGGW